MAGQGLDGVIGCMQEILGPGLVRTLVKQAHEDIRTGVAQDVQCAAVISATGGHKNRPQRGERCRCMVVAGLGKYCGLHLRNGNGEL